MNQPPSRPADLYLVMQTIRVKAFVQNTAQAVLGRRVVTYSDVAFIVIVIIY